MLNFGVLVLIWGKDLTSPQWAISSNIFLLYFSITALQNLVDRNHKGH